MIIKAEQKNTRQPARKVRLVTDVVKKMTIPQAINHLAVMERKSSLLVLKVLRQAVANATNNFGLNVADLEIDRILVNDAPALKRWRAVSRGRAHTILKRACHVRIDLRTKGSAKPVKAVKAATPAVAAPAKATKATKTAKAAATKTTKVEGNAKQAQEAIKLERSKSRSARAKVATKAPAGKLVQSQKKGSK